MIDIRETIIVRRDIQTVFRYVSDLSHMEQWDPGVLRSVKATPGPIRKGTEFQLKCTFFGFPFHMTYRVADLQAPGRIVYLGRGETIRARDTIAFHPVGNGTRIDYALELEVPSKNVFYQKWIRSAVRRIGKNAMGGLGRAFRTDPRSVEMRFLDRCMDKTVLPGMLAFSRYGYLWRRKTWHPLTESLEGRTVLVTGATSGIGKSTALACARMGAETIVVGRSFQKVASVCREIIAETGNNRVRGKVADLGVKAAVRRLAGEVNRDTPRLHVLVNNAGALFGERGETVDGIERSLAINLVSPFLLTNLLMPKLKASAPSRIINVSSGGMYTQRLPTRGLDDDKSPYDGETAYARAKRGLVVLTGIWSETARKSGVSVHAMHPGWTETPGIRKSLPRFYRLTKPILRTPEQGADTVVWLAAAREVPDSSHWFWFDRRPHVIHAFPGTRETERDRIQFIRRLEKLSGVAVAK